MKSIINKESTLRPPLVQIKKLHKKENFNTWSESSTFSKTLLFLSFQTVQNGLRGATLHAFFLFFPTKWPCQPRSISLTEECTTQTTPSKENTNCHNKLALEQWRRMWSQDSSSPLQRKHLFTNDHPLSSSTYPMYESLSKLLLPQNKLTLVKAQEFQNLVVKLCACLQKSLLCQF